MISGPFSWKRWITWSTSLRLALNCSKLRETFGKLFKIIQIPVFHSFTGARPLVEGWVGEPEVHLPCWCHKFRRDLWWRQFKYCHHRPGAADDQSSRRAMRLEQDVRRTRKVYFPLRCDYSREVCDDKVVRQESQPTGSVLCWHQGFE